jgi:hypothetical protein
MKRKLVFIQTQFSFFVKPGAGAPDVKSPPNVISEAFGS